MKKVIKLTASMDGEIVYFNPYRFTFIVEAKPGRRVHVGDRLIAVEESVEEIKNSSANRNLSSSAALRTRR